MRALVDTDILLDIALNREPFVRASAEVIRWPQSQPGQIGVAWHSLSNVAYLVESARGFIHSRRRCDVHRHSQFEGL